MFRRLRLLFAAVALVIPVSGQAQSNWTGAVDSVWDTAGNWSTGSVPTAGDSAVFGAVATANRDIQLTLTSYTLAGLSFADSDYIVGAPGTPATTVLTITGGAISSVAADNGTNLVVPALVEMTAFNNTITVSGNADHELQFGDLEITGTGTFTADSAASLCLGGVTTISGAFVSVGSGEVCTEGGLTAVSADIENGLFMVEGDSSLGNVSVSSNGAISITAGATASAAAVSIAGTVEVGHFSGNGEVLTASQGVTLQNGGRLTGLGTIQGDLTVAAGGQLAPGSLDDTGPLSIAGDVDFQVNSIALFHITAPNVLASALSVTGDLALGGMLSLDQTSELGLYTLIDFTGSLTGTFTGFQDTVAGYNYDVIYNAHSVQLSVTAVPEPAVWSEFVVGGLFGLALLRRRRARRTAK